MSGSWRGLSASAQWPKNLAFNTRNRRINNNRKSTSTFWPKPVTKRAFPNPGNSLTQSPQHSHITAYSWQLNACRLEERFIEMGITIAPFTCGFSRRAHSNCSSNAALVAKIPGLTFGTSPAPVTSPPAIPLSPLPGTPNSKIPFLSPSS